MIVLVVIYEFINNRAFAMNTESIQGKSHLRKALDICQIYNLETTLNLNAFTSHFQYP